MKKIFLSCLFLFLAFVSVDSFAQTVGCSGTAVACDNPTRLNSALGCVGNANAAAGTTVAGCLWNGTTCGGVAAQCNTITNPTICNSVGCRFFSPGDANNNAFVTTLCNALKIVTGSGGKAFAAFAIISCGIGFFTGKISWGLMIGITCGIAAMFGAPTIVAAIAGGNALDCGQ